MFRRKDEQVVDLLHKCVVLCVVDRFGFLFDTNKSVKRVGRLKKFDKFAKSCVERAYSNRHSKSFIQEVSERYNNLFEE